MTRPRLGGPPGSESKRAIGEVPDTMSRAPSSMASTSKRKPAVVMGGVGLIAATALLGALMFSRGSEQRTAIVAAKDIGVGEVITASQLRVVRIARDTDVQSLPSTAASQLLDRVAAVPISKGALVLPDQVARTQSAPVGTVLIGAVLEPGALPSPDLRFGDRVRVLVAPMNSSVDNEPKIATEAIVWRVWGTQQGNATRRAVTLAVPETASVEVGAAAAQSSIRLFVIPNATADPTPVELAQPQAQPVAKQPAAATPIVGN